MSQSNGVRHNHFNPLARSLKDPTPAGCKASRAFYTVFGDGGSEELGGEVTLSDRLRVLPDSRVLVGGSAIALAFLFGGSARADVTSLLWLRPISFFLFAWALWTIRPDDIRNHKFVFAMAAAIVAVVALSLVPLPPSVWQSLPGREIIVQIEEATGSESLWRPLTMTPSQTLNALHFLALPAALLIALAQLEDREIIGLLPVVAIMLGLSVGIGFLQAAGLPLSFYQVDNPVAGLFANRNHQALAIACFLPVITILASRESKKRAGIARGHQHFLAVGIWLAMIPLIFITGSRAGLVLGGAGLILAVFTWQSAAQLPLSRGQARLALGGILVVIVAFVATVLVASDRNLAIQRLIAKDMSNEHRVPIWRTTSDLVWQYMPLGSGPGSFVEVFQIAEENDQLRPRYINHAHNDFLEVALTSGISGVLLMSMALIAFVICAWRISRAKGLGRDVKRYRWLGLGLVALCAAASVVDYPLRTPALACLFVFAVFLAGGGRAPKVSRPQSVV